MDNTYDELGDTVQPSPHYTPNVGIEDPDTRKVVNIVMYVAGIVLGTAVSVDLASEAMDISIITVPASAAYAFLSSIFGFTVTVPNIPKR